MCSPSPIMSPGSQVGRRPTKTREERRRALRRTSVRLGRAENLEQALVLGRHLRGNCARSPRAGDAAGRRRRSARPRHRTAAARAAGGASLRAASAGLSRSSRAASTRSRRQSGARWPGRGGCRSGSSRKYRSTSSRVTSSVLKPVRPRVLGEHELASGSEGFADVPENGLRARKVVQEVVGEDQVPAASRQGLSPGIEPRVGDRREALAPRRLRRGFHRGRVGIRRRGSRRCRPGVPAPARGSRSRSRGRASGGRARADASRAHARTSRSRPFPSRCGSSGAAARRKGPRTESRGGSSGTLCGAGGEAATAGENDEGDCRKSSAPTTNPGGR